MLGLRSKQFGRPKCRQLSSVHALNAPAWSLKRVQLFCRVSSFVRRHVQQGIRIMSPVMVKALVGVSAGNDCEKSYF